MYLTLLHIVPVGFSVSEKGIKLKKSCLDLKYLTNRLEM